MNTPSYHFLLGQACAGHHVTFQVCHLLDTTPAIVAPPYHMEFLKKVRAAANKEIAIDLAKFSLTAKEECEFKAGANKTLQILP